MKARRLTLKNIAAYIHHLYLEERAPATAEKYNRDIHAFIEWLDGRKVEKERVSISLEVILKIWKESLSSSLCFT